jgi:magnesium chelatase accessory protein
MSDEHTLMDRLQAADWPNRSSSRQVHAGGLAWHVQQMGAGPVCLLLHGTGASTHSFRDFAPALARRYTVIMPDLPGHGFTATPDPGAMTLPGFARLIGELLRSLGVVPDVAVGHSAGAAILLRMSLDSHLMAPLIVSLNGALLPFPGVARHLFPALARAAFLNPIVPRFFAWRAQDSSAVERVLTNTGSVIDAAGLSQYAQLFRDPVHVAATLRMMAKWDLKALEADLSRLKTSLVLLATADDRAIPADIAFAVRDKVTGAEVIYLRRLGHLAHEEAPQEIADLVLAQSHKRDQTWSAAIGDTATRGPATGHVA